jgi:hypothetical protein
MIPEEYYNPPVVYTFFGDARNNLRSTNLTISDTIAVTKP